MRRYRVDGMTCGGCAASVTKAIQTVAPDARIEASFEQNLVTVEGFEDDAKIAEAIEASGFDFGGPLPD